MGKDREQIGQGPFHKMVRIALTDPDDELWRYAIEAVDRVIEGEAIRRYAPDVAH